MKVDPETRAYLEGVRATLMRIADGSLLGLYATRSIGFRDVCEMIEGARSTQPSSIAVYVFRPS